MKRPAVNHVTAEQMAPLSLPELRQLLNKQLGLRQRLRDEEAAIRAELGTVTTNIHNIRERIRLVAPASQPVEITDHAVLRYLQRVSGIDLDFIRGALDTDELREAIKRFPTGRHTIDGVTYVTQKGVLVTVIYDDEARLDAPLAKLEGEP
jgi:hypothetical protein